MDSSCLGDIKVIWLNLLLDLFRFKGGKFNCLHFPLLFSVVFTAQARQYCFDEVRDFRETEFPPLVVFTLVVKEIKVFAKSSLDSLTSDFSKKSHSPPRKLPTDARLILINSLNVCEPWAKHFAPMFRIDELKESFFSEAKSWQMFDAIRKPLYEQIYRSYSIFFYGVNNRKLVAGIDWH